MTVLLFEPGLGRGRGTARSDVGTKVIVEGVSENRRVYVSGRARARGAPRMLTLRSRARGSNRRRVLCTCRMGLSSLCRALCQCCQETLMNILKAAVGHDQDHVRWLGIAAEMGNDFCRSWVKPGTNLVCLQRLDQGLGRKACL